MNCCVNTAPSVPTSAHGSHVRFRLTNILLVISVSICVNVESQGAGVVCPRSLLVVFTDIYFLSRWERPSANYRTQGRLIFGVEPCSAVCGF